MITCVTSLGQDNMCYKLGKYYVLQVSFDHVTIFVSKLGKYIRR